MPTRFPQRASRRGQPAPSRAVRARRSGLNAPPSNNNGTQARLPEVVRVPSTHGRRAPV
jgi:hypothetical protein